MDSSSAAWIGAAAALGGVLVGAIAEALRSHLSFRRERKWVVLDEGRQRLEMVYEALEQVRESYGGGVGETIRAVTTGKLAEQGLFASKVPWARLRMLVNLYCPFLLPRLEAVEKAGPKLGTEMARAVMELTGDRRRDAVKLDPVMAALGELNATIDAMRDGIVERSRHLEQKRVVALGETEPPMLSSATA